MAAAVITSQELRTRGTKRVHCEFYCNRRGVKICLLRFSTLHDESNFASELCVRVAEPSTSCCYAFMVRGCPSRGRR